jgi:replicative DNA helicase
VTTPLTDHLPPQSLEAEQACLGSALISTTAAEYVAAELGEPDVWYLHAHRTIQAAIRDLIADGMAVDLLTLPAALEARDALDRCGGMAYITLLTETVPSAAHVEYYGKIVLETATRRRLLDAAQRIEQVAYDTETPVADCLDAAEAACFAAGRNEQRGHWRTAQEIAFAAHDWLHAGEDEQRGIPTGYWSLDQILGSWRPGRLYVLAGRPGAGKTAAACGIALAGAMATYPVGIFSMEMQEQDLWSRLLAITARVDGMRVERGDYDDEERERLVRANGYLGDLPLSIIDDRELTLVGVRGHARRLHRQHGVKLFVLDYIQLVQPVGNREMDHRHFTAVAEGLRSIARELGVAVLALSQLSRASERRENKRPLLSELRESGGIEQAADAALLLYRENYHLRQQGEEIEGPDLTEFNVAKHRQGRCGIAKLWYHGEYLTFSEMDNRHADSESEYERDR